MHWRKVTDHNHDKYITTSEFNKFTAEIFDLKLKRSNVASQSDIANLVNKTDFDNKLLSFNKRINSNVPFENKLNELSKKVEAISTKRLTKHLMNGYKILNGAKYFSPGTLQNHLIYLSYKKYFRFFTNPSKVLSLNL